MENKNVSIWRVMQAGPATVLKTDGLRKWLEFDSTISPPTYAALADVVIATD